MHLRKYVTRFFLALASLSIAFSSFAQDAAEGLKLYEANCISCHAINEKLVGPALKNVHERRQEAWLIKWIRNSQAMIKSGDPIAVQLSQEYNGAVMNSFENLSDGEIKSILAYIKEAGEAPIATATPAIDGGTVASGQAPAGGSFYNSNSFILLGVLALVLFLILVLLISVLGVLKKLVAIKHPETIEEIRPSFWQSTVKPWLASLNPTIATLAVLTVFGIVGGGLFFKYGNEEIGVQQDYAPTQPIAFSHELHAGQYKIDCQYCHSTAAVSKHASVPAVNTCMNCHTYIDAKEKYNGEVSPEIQKVRDAYTNNTPIEWVRIHNLPDLAYFNHAQHVGVANLECQTCHGPIETMAKVKQYSTLQMGWCINCHREAQVDVANNDYYEELHKELGKMGRKSVSVEKIGGLECGKCHY